ncbi:hypothetical protein SDC9_167069 [bioreactor metagenome]|uniref:Uncharacterized protein n=1 Tax=bioreactor metagenome TaxID=1076179 RepID=A0A645FYT8_9ZZZZ
MGIEVAGINGFLFEGKAYENIAKPLFEVFHILCEAEDCHNLRGSGDIKPGFARNPVLSAAKPYYDMP